MALVITMTVFSLVGTILISFSMLPQTIVTMRTKQTAELSFGLYLLMGFATFLIFFYGVGLVMVPTNLKELVKAANTDQKSFFFGKFTDAFIKSIPDSKSIILGYIVPGSAILIGEIFCSVTSFMIAYVKIKNKKAAAKLGITETEYIARTYPIVATNNSIKGDANE